MVTRRCRSRVVPWRHGQEQHQDRARLDERPVAPQAAGGSEGAARSEEVHRRGGQAAHRRARLERARARRRRTIPGLRARDAAEGRPQRRLPVPAGDPGGARRRQRVVLHRQPGRGEHQRLLGGALRRPGGLHHAGAAAPSGGMAVPAPVVRARQRAHRHRLRDVRARSGGHLPRRRPSSPPEPGHARAERVGRSARVARGAATDVPDRHPGLHHPRAPRRPQHPHPHEDPAEPHRCAPGRPLRVDVRRRAPAEAGEGHRGRGRRGR